MTLIKVRLNPIVALLLCALPPLWAQEPVIRIDVRLVQVDAVVTDSKSRHVSNLKASDFEILQDGKPQRITDFSYIELGASTTAARSTGNPPAPISTPQTQGLAAPPKPAEVRRMIALVVDDLGLSFDSMAHVRDALRKYVNGEMQPGDMAAIVRTSSGMGMLQQFTSNRAVLNAAIDHIKFTIGRVDAIPDSAPPPTDEVAARAAAAEAALDQFRTGVLTGGTFGTLRYVIDGLRDMPGRKSIILFSENLQLLFAAQDTQMSNGATIVHSGVDANLSDSLRGLTDAANRSSVVINTIDPRGLQYFRPARGGRGRGVVNPGLDQQAASREGLVTLARDTGGLFIRDNNRIDEALREVVEDTQGYYLIGYHPDAATFDSKTGAPLYHRIQVRLRAGGGLQVRSRSGFFGETDSARRGTQPTIRAAMMSALTSPFSPGDIPVQLTTLFNETPDRHPNLSSLLHIDAHELSFTTGADGVRHAGFEVVAMTFGVEGKPINHTDRSFRIDLNPDQYEDALARGVVYVVNQPVETPGLYQMRVALRDENSQRLGVANQAIEVPDLKAGNLTLSSILLRQDAGAGTAAGDTATAAALRAFKPGTALSYQYIVFNAKPGSANKADLEVQTRLYREGKLVYTGQPMVPAFQGDVTSGRLTAGGHMTLAKSLVPGDYLFQIVVTNKLANEKFRSTVQAIDFEVLP